MGSVGGGGCIKVVKILLDSNAFYWFMMKPEKFGRAASNRVELAPILYFSAASVFELSFKSQRLVRGKPSLELPKDFGSIAIAAGMEEIPVRTEHAALADSFLSFESGDPIDRMILSQALHEDAILITSDQKMLALGYDWIVDAKV